MTFGNGRRAGKWVGRRASKTDWTPRRLPSLLLSQEMSRPDCEPQGFGAAKRQPEN
jgi:hypothetical protein